MRIIFDNYYRYLNNNDKKTYNATISNPKADNWRNDYMFDEKYFRELVAKNRYEDAALYAEQFHFNDRTKDDEHRRNIARLRREGEQVAALQKQMNPEDFSLYKLGITLRQNSSITPLLTNGVNHLLPNKPSFTGSYYTYDRNANAADKLATALNRLGSIVNKDGSLNYASSLSITFQPEVQKRWGVDWLDWAKADNPNTAEAYYQRLGLTEEDLKSNGIEIIHENGDSANGTTTLKFSKSNPLTYKLLSKLYDRDVNQNGWGSYGEIVKGYDDKGNVLGQETLTNLEQDRGYSNMLPILNILNAAENKVNDVDNNILHKNTGKSYTSLRVGPLMTNEIYDTQTLYQQGKLTDEQYKYNMAVAEQHIFGILASISNDQKMYSNFKNQDKKDESLQEVNNIDRKDLQEYLSYNLDKRPEKITLQTAVQDGTYGVLVTINAHDKDESVDKDIDEQRIQIFMPGLQSDKVQQVFENDPASRAAVEANSISDYGYKYKLAGGETLEANNDGTFNLSRNGSSVTLDRTQAERKIQESILVNDAKHEIIDAYLNDNGEITDIASYRSMAKQFAIRTANEIYSDLPEIGTNNKASIYSAKEIFNESKVTDKNVQYEMWNKILAARNMYELLLKELDNYM